MEEKHQVTVSVSYWEKNLFFSVIRQNQTLAVCKPATYSYCVKVVNVIWNIFPPTYKPDISQSFLQNGLLNFDVKAQLMNSFE